MKGKLSSKVKVLTLFYDTSWIINVILATHVESRCDPNCLRSQGCFKKHICEVTDEYYMNNIPVGHN